MAVRTGRADGGRRARGPDSPAPMTGAARPSGLRSRPNRRAVRPTRRPRPIPSYDVPRVARIEITASPMELGLFAGEYDALAEALTEEGHQVQLESPDEYRS